MSRPLISIVTYPRGGPRRWSEGLAKALTNYYKTQIVAGRSGYIRASLSRHHVLHTNVGLPFSLANRSILTIHGDYRKEKLLGRMVFPFAIRNADAITVPSYFLKQQLNLTNAIVIPNGINYPPLGKDHFELASRRPTIGTLTNFDFPRKADGIIDLARIVKEHLPTSRLLVGGNGAYIKRYQKRVYQIFPNTEFLGFCRTEELFSKLDVFAYYSFLDNQPLALLEAMAYGLPTISNNVGAVSEILTNSLSHNLCNSPHEYGQRLQQLVDSTDSRLDSGSRSRLKAKKYSWPRIAHQFIQLYEA